MKYKFKDESIKEFTAGRLIVRVPEDNHLLSNMFKNLLKVTKDYGITYKWDFTYKFYNSKGIVSIADLIRMVQNGEASVVGIRDMIDQSVYKQKILTAEFCENTVSHVKSALERERDVVSIARDLSIEYGSGNPLLSRDGDEILVKAAKFMKDTYGINCRVLGSSIVSPNHPAVQHCEDKTPIRLHCLDEDYVSLNYIVSQVTLGEYLETDTKCLYTSRMYDNILIQ